jgi:hypothetical protein
LFIMNKDKNERVLRRAPIGLWICANRLWIALAYEVVNKKECKPLCPQTFHPKSNPI